MKIASHNSFTYLQPHCWWMRPFAFMARCQNVHWSLQYACGAELFDLRVRFDKRTDLPYICHGLMRYEGNVYDTLGGMVELATYYDKQLYMRVVLEKKKPSRHEADLFRGFCSRISEHYGKRLLFFGGNDRSDWSGQYQHYRFRTPAQDLDNKYSSTTTLWPRGWRWLRLLDDLCPILYARLHNPRNIEKGTGHDWLFIDFVNIR